MRAPKALSQEELTKAKNILPNPSIELLNKYVGTYLGAKIQNVVEMMFLD
ncbi:hypothetical protein SAMN04487898_109187 [Pedobacter sp. ok626]|nr:hypothetical protein [Pedobacter sp. ok626]SDK58159.1 hypothetical protein SAMN04487898_109187 [Pedobacter sp. ok626]